MTARRRILAVALALLAAGLLAAGAGVPRATADGDPGSDVLVAQSLFVPPDAGIGVPQQSRLAALVAAARARGVPVRVAIIARPDDLGAVTALWGRPQTYANFLGLELSLAFKGPLLVVMPDGLGLHWPGHAAQRGAAAHAIAAIRPGPDGLLAATREAVRRLAATGSAGARPGGSPTARPPASAGLPGATGGAASGVRGGPTILGGGDRATTVLAGAVLVALLAAALVVWLVATARGRRRRVWPLAAMGALAAATFVALLVTEAGGGPRGAVGTLADNPDLDPGQRLSGRPAPNFSLYDQFGRRMTLRQYRGRIVLLAFDDAECTTICPLTTTAMLDAKRMLGAAGRHVQLLGVDANPKDTQVQDVLSYSQLHGLTDAWRFGTGSLRQLDSVWRAYHVQAAIRAGLISHTPALFVIDQRGRERRLYVTQQSYAAVPQLGEMLAQEISALLPGHPPVARHVSYGRPPSITPTVRAELPREGGGTETIGPGRPRLYVFFDTWVREVMGLGGDLEALNRYADVAARTGLPALTAVDEGSVEPSVSALPEFLHSLTAPLRYPIAIDNTGEVADGYQVQGEPWLVLTSSRGRVLWYRAPDTAGWPATRTLETEVRAALRRGPTPPPSAAAARRLLRDSPPPLAALHRQAGRLLGAGAALTARLHALRGHPIVVNIWASSCEPCETEFGLFASASAHFGRRVAFLGVDYDDETADAEAFLRSHPVSYPSYSARDGQLSALLRGGLQGTPTTVYLAANGRVVAVHTGAYDSQGALDGDIAALVDR